MPHYIWKGLDVQGQTVRGVVFALCLEDLEKLLLKRNIGLLKARPRFFARSLSSQEKMAFFSQLSSLLNAHIPLHASLTTIASTAQGVLKTMIGDCADLIAQGATLSEALKMHDITDELCQALLVVGERTGKMGETLRELVDHQTIMTVFKQRVRASLVGPLITLFVFFFVMFGIFIGVIPRFEVYFSTYNGSLPVLTQTILNISSFIRSSYMLYTVLSCIIAGAVFSVLTQTTKAKRIMEAFPLLMPGIGSFYRAVCRARFFTTISLLTKNGVPLAQALAITVRTTENHVIKDQVSSVMYAVEAGQSLSSALRRSVFSDREIDAFVTIGESSGNLQIMLTQSAELCRQKIYSTINGWATLIQPLVLLVLGALIGCLIFAIYLPLLSLSSLII